MEEAKEAAVSTDLWEKLRRPFDLDQIELLPKYTGQKVNGRAPREAYRQCQECGGYHAFPCVHLNYVGHAQITDRLNEVDPIWNWEPCGVDQGGQPIIVNGGMWIKLTVLGVTRYGYGDAQGKQGHDATKEIIGDAIRNAAMRFGVGSYLWSKSERAKQTLVGGNHDEPGPVNAQCKGCGIVWAFQSAEQIQGAQCSTCGCPEFEVV